MSGRDPCLAGGWWASREYPSVPRPSPASPTTPQTTRARGGAPIAHPVGHRRFQFALSFACNRVGVYNQVPMIGSTDELPSLGWA